MFFAEPLFANQATTACFVAFRAFAQHIERKLLLQFWTYALRKRFLDVKHGNAPSLRADFRQPALRLDYDLARFRVSGFWTLLVGASARLKPMSTLALAFA